MIIGMFPMALGLGEGGEQTAPLGRRRDWRVIFATGATLFFVRTAFRFVSRRGSIALICRVLVASSDSIHPVQHIADNAPPWPVIGTRFALKPILFHPLLKAVRPLQIQPLVNEVYKLG
jgi:hypothetical protein